MKKFLILFLAVLSAGRLNAQGLHQEEQVRISGTAKAILGQMFARENQHLDSVEMVKHFDDSGLRSVVARFVVKCTPGPQRVVTAILPATSPEGDIQALELVEKKNRLVPIDSAMAKIDGDYSTTVQVANLIVTASKSTCFQQSEQVSPSAYFWISLWLTEAHKYLKQIGRISSAMFAELR